MMIHDLVHLGRELRFIPPLSMAPVGPLPSLILNFLFVKWSQSCENQKITWMGLSACSWKDHETRGLYSRSKIQCRI